MMNGVDNMKPFFPWVGGKRSLIGEIDPRIPAHHTFIEVFGGGGAVLFAKEISKFEIYNDFNGDLVNLFQVVKEKPLSFIDELGLLTINSRRDFFYLLSVIENKEEIYDGMDEELTQVDIAFKNEKEYKKVLNKILTTRANRKDVNRAVAFYRVLKTSYAASGTSWGGTPIYMDLRKIYLEIMRAKDRLSRVVIENQSYEVLIPKHSHKEDTFFYCDPPYYKTEEYYGGFYPEDHQKLRDTLGDIKGKFLLSYNDCEYIRELYKDYHIVEVTRLNNIKQRYDAGSEYKEVLIANYDISKKRNRLPQQLRMWGYDYDID